MRPVIEPTLAVGLPVGNKLYKTHELHRMVELARIADEAGVHTVAFPDHVVMGSSVDEYEWGRYQHTPETPWLEPLTLLASIASVTRSVRLATSILIAPLRPAALLAKIATTLDILSQGRLELGVGTGWQSIEFEAEGLKFARRGRALTDTIAACRALWTKSPATFSSETVSFVDVWCEPKPVQIGGPPILFSGTLTKRNIDRITNLGDGWIPIMGATQEDIGHGVQTIRDHWLAAGRDPARLKVRAPLPVVVFHDKPDLDATIDLTAQWVARGVSEVLVRIADFVSDPDEAGKWFNRLTRCFEAQRGAGAG